MFTTRTCTLIVLALPLAALVIACSDDPSTSRPVKDGPTIVTGEDSEATESAASTPAPSAPGAGTTSTPQETTTGDAGTTPPKGDGDAGGGGGGGGGLDPTDCALQEGQACLQCCLENNGGANNDIVNCVQNCVN